MSGPGGAVPGPGRGGVSGPRRVCQVRGGGCLVWGAGVSGRGGVRSGGVCLVWGGGVPGPGGGGSASVSCGIPPPPPPPPP